MAKITVKPKLEFKTILEIDEEELAALEAIFSYSPEGFLKTFYKEMGESYLKPHEVAVIRLHNTFRHQLSHELKSIKKAKELLAVK